MTTLEMPVIDSFAPHLTWAVGPKLNVAKKILVLEDDICLQPVISRIIKSIDPKVEIAWATDLPSAFANLEGLHGDILRRRSPFSLILSDIFLPNMENGIKLWTFCQEQSAKIPFAFMSSCSADDYLKLFKGLRAPPYIPKPFRASDCKQVLRSFLG